MSSPYSKTGQNIVTSFAMLAVVTLFVCCGCRGISKDPVPTIYPSQAPEFSPGSQMSNQPPASLLGSPVISPETSAVISDISEERIQSFRPIIPPSAMSQLSPVSQPSSIVSQATPATPLPSPSQISQTRLDDLNNRIIVLEKALAEKEEQLRIAQLPKPLSSPPNKPVQPLPGPNPEQLNQTTVQKQIDQTTVKQIKPMPVLGIPGVLVSAHPEKEEVRIQLPDSILFTTGTWQLNPAAEESLRKIAGEIRTNYPQASLDIEGHTDNIDNDPTNKTQKHDIASYKSMLIMQYFVKTLAWDAAKIKSSSHGPSRPVADNTTPEGRNRNNRIEIVVSP